MHSHSSTPYTRASSIIHALLTPILLLSFSVSAHAQEPKRPNPFPGNSSADDTNTSSAAPQTSRAPATSLSSRGFELNLEGYMQARYQRIENDEEVGSFIGRNDGFGLSNARVNLDARRKRVSAFLSLEGARDRRLPNNRAQGEVRTLILDAYFTYRFAPALKLQLGRFKPAYDANELESTAGLLFADRALESRGVLGVEGLNVAGLSLPRQAGVQLNGVVPFDRQKDVRLKYYLSVVNGNTAEQPLNDNDNLAVVSRVELDLRVNRNVRFKVGGGAYFNQISEGELPDLISEDRVGYTADASLGLYALVLRGQWMQQTSTFIDVPDEPERIAQGYHLIAGLKLGKLTKTLRGIVPAYRFAHYDPTWEAESDNSTLAAGLDADAVTHHTVGLNVFFNQTRLKAPLKLQVNYTIADEQEARRADNDRLDVLLQMSF